MADDLPPGPYQFETTAAPGKHHGMGHVYIIDANGRRIASIWGKPGEKVALADLIIRVSTNGVCPTPTLCASFPDKPK